MGVPTGVQKNVRLSERGAELLRALKYDLDASDGEVIAAALEDQALKRLKYHVATLKRGRLGLIDEAEAAPSQAPIPPLLAALNYGGERFSIKDRLGVVQTKSEDRDGEGFGNRGDATRVIVDRSLELVKEMALPKVTVAVLLLACCESPEGRRCSGLGVPIEALAGRLRETLAKQKVDTAKPSRTLTWSAKSVVVEGCKGIAALDGVGGVRVEHILVAALQSEDPELVQIRRDLGINADVVRALLWGGPRPPRPESDSAPAEPDSPTSAGKL